MPNRKHRHEDSHEEEILHIRDDLDSLRSNVVALTKTVQHEISDSASDTIGQIRDKSLSATHTIEKDVRKKPLQSLAAAFGAGLVLSLMMKRR